MTRERPSMLSVPAEPRPEDPFFFTLKCLVWAALFEALLVVMGKVCGH